VSLGLSYSGTGTSTQQEINCGFTPAIVWVKNITVGTDWHLIQSNGKSFYINSSVKAFDSINARSATSSTGFSVGISGTNANGDLNASGSTYIYAAWK
jgi:hypothetical protein